MELKSTPKSLLSLFEGNLFRSGKRHAAARTLFVSLRRFKHANRDGLNILLRTMVVRSFPYVTLRSKKIGGSVYQIPVHLNEDKQDKVAVKWLTMSCGKKLGSRSAALQKEFLLSSSSEGVAAQKKKSLHTLAIANRAYVKYL